MLKKSGFGCYVGDTFLGALSYADDITLLAPTKFALRRMISLCNAYSEEFQVKFNPSKSKLVVFGDKEYREDFWTGTDIIKCLDHDVHLGNDIGINISRKQIDTAIGDMYSRCNLLLSQFGRAFCRTKYRLFKAFCLSLYGCVLWDFSNPYIEKFYTAWRKCIRRVLGVPSNTHCNLLSILCEDVSIDLQLYMRFLRFIRQCLFSANQCLYLCGKLVINGSCSKSCNSLNVICNKLNVSKYQLVNLEPNNLWDIVTDIHLSSRSTDDELRASIISELIFSRDRKDFRILSRAENNDVLTYLCTY